MKFLQWVLGVIIIAFIVWVFWLFIGYFQSSTDEIKASLIGVGSLIIITNFTQFKSKQREIAKRHFIEKSEAYGKIFGLVFDVLEHANKGTELSDEELTKKAFDIKRSLMIWGSEDVLKAWNKYEKEANIYDSQKTIKNIESILKYARKDLGHNDNSFADGELLQLIIIPEEKELFIEQTLKGKKDV